MSDALDARTAYAAMYDFLEVHYERTRSEDIGNLLSFMCILESGGTTDPAMWDDWEKSIKNALAGNVDLSLGLKA